MLTVVILRQTVAKLFDSLPEAFTYSDVISGVAVDYVNMDVRATFGESGLNGGRII